jgi:dipeptide transport system substrate-binding protein
MQAPFDKAEVRKALNMAINKEAIVKSVFEGAPKSRTDPADHVVL